ncbi:hypothetical protein [Mycobacterium intracellulare]|uniref:Uncharacterized protein n=1 Tax=Mycobacterium intracellulare subsp. chimaera TaxID=222805 RepID=A0ABT7P9H9_MYCIT|nr:hypothetical protein [Mycobacterium intracellulare]MDM3929820.1 hypothetical protein [Mycobacterium intracellulare subsp. chimaera]
MHSAIHETFSEADVFRLGALRDLGPAFSDEMRRHGTELHGSGKRRKDNVAELCFDVRIGCLTVSAFDQGAHDFTALLGDFSDSHPVGTVDSKAIQVLLDSLGEQIDLAKAVAKTRSIGRALSLGYWYRVCAHFHLEPLCLPLIRFVLWASAAKCTRPSLLASLRRDATDPRP